MKKKKIIFLSHTLDIGGIETSILNYMKLIDKSKYDIYLMLEDAYGIYLNELPKHIHLINYNICKSKNIFLRKLINGFKLIYFSIKYHNKFDFSACFATYLKSASILAKRFSKNNALWIHGNFWSNEDEAHYFLKYINAYKYKKVIFVSNALKNKYLDIQPYTKQKLYVLNNPINGKEIIKKSSEKINLTKNKLTLLNVGRHEECSKQLIPLFEVCYQLLVEGYDFNLWVVGDGPDHNIYIDKVKSLNLQNNIVFFGKQDNVFPFYKLCDAVVLSSNEEGNPVVFLEAKTLSKPLISTNVSDASTDLKGYGIVVPFGKENLYNGLKQFLDNGYTIKEVFNTTEYNKQQLTSLYKIIDE